MFTPCWFSGLFNVLVWNLEEKEWSEGLKQNPPYFYQNKIFVLLSVNVDNRKFIFLCDKPLAVYTSLSGHYIYCNTMGVWPGFNSYMTAW